MEMTGVVELIEKTNAKGNTYFSVRVAGQYVGNAYQSVVKDLKTGDYVRATYVEKGNFKNVTHITPEKEGEKTNPVTETAIINSVREIPYPKGFEPHPTVVNEKALYLALLLVNSQEEGKKLTKKSLMTRLAVAFELAGPVKNWLLNGVIPDGTAQLSDED